MIVFGPLLEEEHKAYVKATRTMCGFHTVNPLIADLPEGTTMCGACGEWIDGDTYRNNRITCPNGHEHEVDIRKVKGPKSGGFTLCGWTLSQFGYFCEEVVFSVDHLYVEIDGQIVSLGKPMRFPGYHNPLDGYTDLGFGIEIKGTNWLTKYRSFSGGSVKTRERKVEYAREMGLNRDIAQVLNVADFSQHHSRLHTRLAPKIIAFSAFERLGRPDQVVRFENPFADRPQPEMPF